VSNRDPGAALSTSRSASTGSPGHSHGEPFVRLLGPVQFVTAGGESIDLPSVTQRQVLAALALEPGATVRPDLLCDRLGLTGGALRTTVSRLRGRIGADAIATDALGYRVTCRTDAEGFERLLLDPDHLPDRIGSLRSALDLWTGPALDEFRHESWSDALVFRLDELHGLAMEELAEAQIDQGRGGESIALLEGHVATNPLRDRARGLQIRAMASVGRQADALRAYQVYRRYLAEETGTEPSADVVAIERRVASGWDGRTATQAEDTATLVPAEALPARTFDVPLHPHLASDHGAGHIGRVAELVALDDELAAVIARGSARGVLIAGDAGIGKTTLVGTFARSLDARGEATILCGRCGDGVTDPLQPFRSVVASLVAAAPTNMLADHARRCGGDLQRIAPGIAHRTWVPPPTSADEATERHQLFESVADLLARASQHRPLVVVLEDIHWAEPTALLLMRHLISTLGAAPILVVATHRDRPADQSDELRTMLSDLDRSGIRRLALTEFADEELGGLVQQIVESDGLISDQVVAAIREQTAGNPLYASQLTRHLVDVGKISIEGGRVSLTGSLDDVQVPATLADLVWSRVRALDGATPEVLRSASVLGSSFDEDVLQVVSGRSDAEVSDALASGIRAGLLVMSPDRHHRFRFVHALVARALYSDIDASSRQRQHRLAADALERRDEHLPLRTVAQLARHRARAGDHDAAQGWASVAGDRAMAQLASVEAARWYETALGHARHLDRPDPDIAALLVTLGTAYVRAGDLDAAATILAQAAELALRSGANGTFVDAVLASERFYMRVAAPDLGQLELVETALLVVDEGDSARQARLLALHALELIHTPRDDDRLRSALRAIELCDHADDPTLLAKLVSALIFALWGLGTLDLRLDLAQRADEAARRSSDPLLRFWSSRASWYVAVESADAEMARTAFARMRAISGRIEERRLAWNVGVFDTFEATMAARIAEAEVILDENLELGLAIGDQDAITIYGAQFFALRSFAGRYAELLPLLEDMVRQSPGIIALELARVLACAVEGQPDAARSLLAEHLPAGLVPTSDHYGLTTLVAYAVTAIELSDEEVAAALYEALLPYHAQVAYNGATSQGPVAAYLGKLASILGRHDLADSHLRSALAITESWGWRYHEASTLVAMARSRFRSTGALDDTATRWLDRAGSIAQECDLAILARQIHDLTADAQGTPDA